MVPRRIIQQWGPTKVRYHYISTRISHESSSIRSSVPTCVELFTDPVSAGAIARAAALEAAGGGRGVQRGRRVLLAVARLLQLVDLLLRVVDAIKSDLRIVTA